MTTLAELQNLFQHYVLEGDARLLHHIAPPHGHGSVDERAGIYAQAYRLRLREALASNYPRLEQLVGQDCFETIADAYIDTHRSREASIRWFGDALASALELMFPEQPWLADLARWEWEVANAFDAADATPVCSADVQRVQPESWPSVQFEFHPSVRCLQLQTNAAQLFKALSEDEPAPEPTATNMTFWLIWRQKLTTRYRSMLPAEVSALNTMQAGGTFEDMCTTLCISYSPDEAAMQAARLLRTWIDEELVCKVLHDAHSLGR